jgi:transketolase
MGNMPCWELFNLQDKAYQQAVLGSTVRIGIEAAIRQGWDQYLGFEGDFVGMSGFGESGVADELYKLFNITTEAVVEKVHRLLAEVA